MELTPEQLTLGLVWYVVFLFSTTLHEASHALVAYRLGDRTAYEGGQVTLNPIPHVRRAIFGTVVVPLVSFALSGWMIGWASAPYDPAWARRHPRRAALMSLAGPAANLSLAGLAAAALRTGLATGIFASPEQLGFSRLVASADGFTGLATALSILFTLNLLLGLFNLLPVPPLDGSGALPLVLSTSAARRYQEALLGQPGLALLGLVIAWRLFGELFQPLFLLAVNLLHPGVTYGP